MRKSQAEQCAYCSKPLRLVAGFCANCHAPAAIAQRARLIAAAQRRSALIAPLSSSTDVTTLAPAPTVSPRPQPRWARVVLIIGLVSLVLTVFFITLRLNGDTLPLPFLPRSSTLVASTTTDGAATTAFSAGQTLYLRYAVAVTHNDAAIQLRVAPDHSPAYLLTEQWPRGDTHRTLPLLPLAAGNWHITLLANGQVIQSLTLAIRPAS